jgi:hypothetical protein
VTLAIPQGEGRPPLGLALLARPKTDQRLAEVAAEVAPILRAVSHEKIPSLTPRAERSSPRAERSSPKQSKGRHPIRFIYSWPFVVMMRGQSVRTWLLSALSITCCRLRCPTALH